MCDSPVRSLHTVTQNNASPVVRNTRKVSTALGMGGMVGNTRKVSTVVGMGCLYLPLAKSDPNNEYNLGECHGDGWDHLHNSVLVEAGFRKKHMRFQQHNEARSEPLAPGGPASHIGDAVREIQALAAEAAC